MTIVRLGGVFLLAIMALACQPSVSPDKEASSLSRDALVAKARAFAERELARLSAAELLYRNRVYLHVYEIPDFGVESSVHVKTYRQFMDYEIVDVTRSDSLLRPYAYEIGYTYEVLSTDGSTPGTSVAASAREAAKDYRFRPIRSGTMTVRYECDENGEPVEAGPQFLERPNFFNKNAKNSIGAFRTEEVPRQFLGAPARGKGP